MSEMLSLARRTNAAIDAAMLMPSCRSALRAKKDEIRVATRARDMLMLFQRAVTTGRERCWAASIERRMR